MRNEYPHRRTLALFARIAVVALVLSACVSAPPIPEENYYLLPEPHPAVVYAKPLVPAALSVPRLQANGVYNERAMIYVDETTPLDLHTYHYHSWNDVPALMIRDHLVAYLRASHAAPQVMDPAGGAFSQERVVGRILHFERRIGATTVKVDVQLELGIARADGTWLFEPRTYRAVLAAPSRAVHASAATFGRALDEICARFLAQLQTVVARSGPAG